MTHTTPGNAATPGNPSIVFTDGHQIIEFVDQFLARYAVDLTVVDGDGGEEELTVSVGCGGRDAKGMPTIECMVLAEDEDGDLIPEDVNPGEPRSIPWESVVKIEIP